MRTLYCKLSIWLLLLVYAPSLIAAANALLRPDDNRFTVIPVTPPNSLAEPMSFEVLPDGRAFIIERRGGIKLFDPSTQTVKSVGMLTVNTVGNNEQGLVGMTLDPKFAENGWMYLYYFHPTVPKAILSRWEVRENVLVANSEKLLLEWPAQRETCCHTGGGMTWDKDGNLLLTVGNNRGNTTSAQTDERPGRSAWDDQGGAANSNSLEGKILRIHPEPDGTYTIPKGNLFPPGTPKTRPEIYTMGHRNAWRVSVDSKTGFIYWGEVGPDGRQDSDIGPLGYDELNQARGPGFFGWPYFVGDKSFPLFDFSSGKPGERLDPLKPINKSPNNTGVVELPPMAPAFIYYPYGSSAKFPEVGSGGRSATGGPIYRSADFKAAKRPWPAYFEGKWIATDLSRRWIISISMSENGDYKSMERIVPKYRPVEPIDMKFGPDGDLYVLEYGGRWFQGSPEAKLSRIEFEAGNRKPVVLASANKAGGIPPFDVVLSSAGTEDYDRDELKFQWVLSDLAGNKKILTEPNPTVKLDAVGTYIARLTVTDSTGASDSKSVKIVSGNEPPSVDLKLVGNESYFFPDRPFGYAVAVHDAEDGSLQSGRIPKDKVSFSIDYVSSDFDLGSFASMPPGDELAAKFPVAQSLITKGNCRSCHLSDAKLVGPSFLQIADKYRSNSAATAELAKKIVTGGSGVWGPVAMPPNSLISEADATTILKYILSHGSKDGAPLPLSGDFTPKIPPGDDGSGMVILRAAYSDVGDDLAPSLWSQKIAVLRSPMLPVSRADRIQGVVVENNGANATRDGFLAFNGVDLTGVKHVEIAANAMSFGGHKGGEIEIRLNSPDGPLLGSRQISVTQMNFGGGRGGAGRGGNPGGPPPQSSTTPQLQVPPEVLPGGNSALNQGQGRGGQRGVGGGFGTGARGGARGGRGRGFGPAPSPISIQETKGRHDLYLVFRNKEAAPMDTLMSVRSLRLSAQASVSESAPITSPTQP